MAEEAKHDDSEALEMDEILENITFYCYEETKGKLQEEGECAPFTVIVEGDQMFVENYPDEDVETCRANAKANVKTASTFATHYAFCYDGFLMTDQGQLDAIIVECATRDMESSYIIALLYKQDDDTYTFEETPAFIEDGETFFDAAAVQHTEEEEAREADTEQEILERLDPQGKQEE